MIQNQLTRVEDFITPDTNISKYLKGAKTDTHVCGLLGTFQILRQVKCVQIAKTNYTIVRPLINCPRRTITMACVLSKLPVYPDLTNAKVRYSRNRLRKQIIPSLQFFFNPQVEKALFKFSEFSKL